MTGRAAMQNPQAGRIRLILDVCVAASPAAPFMRCERRRVGDRVSSNGSQYADSTRGSNGAGRWVGEPTKVLLASIQPCSYLCGGLHCAPPKPHQPLATRCDSHSVHGYRRRTRSRCCASRPSCSCKGSAGYCRRRWWCWWCNRPMPSLAERLTATRAKLRRRSSACLVRWHHVSRY
jgi:hypothetical protein